MHEVLIHDGYIRSLRARREFRRRVVQRFDEEGALVALIGEGIDTLDPDFVQSEAAALVQTTSEDEMFARIGDALPEQVRDFLQQVDELARRGIPPAEQRYLPPPRHLLERGQLGRTVMGSIRRVLWRSLCDPDSDLYKAWVHEGMGVVLSKKYVAAALTASLTGLGIGLKALAVSAAALVMRFGLEVFCDGYAPEAIMTPRRAPEQR